MFDQRRAALQGLKALFGTPFHDVESRSQYQAGLLVELLHHAARNVPLYTSKYSGFDPKAALRGLPLLSREEVQPGAPFDFVARTHDKRQLNGHDTSGSDGRPLTVHRTTFEDRLLQAFRVKRFRHLGLCWSDRRAGLSFSYGRPEQVRYRPALLRLGALYRAPIHYQHEPAEVVRQLRHIRPSMIGGYPVILAQIAAHLNDEDRAKLPLKFAVTGGDTLTAAARLQIEAGFGVKAFNFYGMNEVVLAASECPQTGLFHLSSETMIGEVLCGDRPAEVGETGEFTVTSLHSYAMPFIRYQPGDLVEKGPDPCPCGAPYPTLSAIRGRVADLFVLPDGSKMHPFEIDGLLKGYVDAMRRYQVVQTQPNAVEIRVVPKDKSLIAQTAAIEARLESLRTRGLRVSLRWVDELPARDNGKFRLYVPFRENARPAA